MREPAVYIMASRRNGTIYTGVTANLARRAFEHREGIRPGFTRKYRCHLLVWYEWLPTMPEAIGCFGAELEVVPDRVAEVITRMSSLVMLGMGAGRWADAQYLFAEDVLGHTAGHKPRHAKTYRNFATEYARLQQERIGAFREFNADVASGAYPAPQHTVPVADDEFERFLALIKA
ncbi:MAG: 3-methyl-2-oxobutanoate hydroxymethyltransferase [Hyphomicrobiales bacterium]|nr:3-methyl-2-oxobutanoate hydroxymethyltransferase [Hyphomicrobiales bacterium]